VGSLATSRWLAGSRRGEVDTCRDSVSSFATGSRAGTTCSPRSQESCRLGALVEPEDTSIDRQFIDESLSCNTFTCLPRNFSLSAPGFRSQVPQFQAEFLNARMVTDAHALNDGQGNFEIACGYTLGGAQLAADRPRDVLDANGSQFVTAATLSSSQIQQRCNNICFNDCSVSFGVDALGAQFCTDVCTPDCVSRATTNTDQCPSCNECSQQSDCGSPGQATCAGGCCIQVIN